ncbi:MAG: putative Na+/H+ antiporter [Oligoflexia bacterium]|nr:putative Na+/H+ antiporter [Oligoflexia bacterium]
MSTWVSFSELTATVCFALAILHTFTVKQFHRLGGRFRPGSAAENFFHLLGEVEIVFGLWAAIYLVIGASSTGVSESIHHLQSQNFTEPAFVFVILTVCSTRPILEVSRGLVSGVSRLLPLSRPVAFYLVALVVGPLLGSFITEPAAMTVTAMLLLDRFYSRKLSPKLMYATLGLLFVNVSIGGVLTPFAAPPVLMVAGKWQWDLSFMLTHFGWKAAIAILVSTSAATFLFRKELGALAWENTDRSGQARRMPAWVYVIHLLFLAMIVATSHYLAVFMGLFLFFLGLAAVTREYQNELKLREGLLVGFFLAGLVVLGGPQRWWLEPLLARLDALWLYLGAATLTAFTDNAALTYLGSQVPTLTEASRYFLVAGAVVGGGLTVIANAPNPAGYGILNPSFGVDGISPIRLFLFAFPPTVVAVAAFWFL